MFKPGDKVVCVNDSCNATIIYRIGRNYISGLSGLKKGEVYTVRSTYINTAGVSHECIRVSEIIRRICPTQNVETGFAAFRFAPYVPVTTERELEAVQ